MRFGELHRLVVENDEITNLLPIDAIRQHAEENDEIFAENDNHLVIRPRSHSSVCYYGQYTLSRFCLANPDDDSDWNQLESVRAHTGEPASFFYIFSKKISRKNKKSILGMVIYPRQMSGYMLEQPTDEIIAQGRSRFQSQYGGDISYDDEFLTDWIEQVKSHRRFFESYNSKNKIVKPDELVEMVGSSLFDQLIAV